VTVLYKEAAHRILEVGWDGNKLVGVVETLRTPNGTIAKNLAEDGIPIRFSFRGMGDLKQVTESGEQFFDVTGPLFTVSFDIVSFPSHMEAKITKITESVFAGLQESFAGLRGDSSKNMKVLNEAYQVVHNSRGIVEQDGLICTNEGISYFPNEFDQLVEQRVIRLMEKFTG
jgi:hypothetical protein